MTHSSPELRTIASSAAFARTYGVGPSGAAFTTLRCTIRRTPASRAAATSAADCATARS